MYFETGQENFATPSSVESAMEVLKNQSNTNSPAVEELLNLLEAGVSAMKLTMEIHRDPTKANGITLLGDNTLVVLGRVDEANLTKEKGLGFFVERRESDFLAEQLDLLNSAGVAHTQCQREITGADGQAKMVDGIKFSFKFICA